ncbi:MAG: hypothetical protein F6K31_34320 [Symploca sp. SIO2G7]|nr:hypothetical protein [Symploca sp. SIO2G7]
MQRRLTLLFLTLLVLDATLIYLSKDPWAIGRIFFTAAIMYLTLEGYRWAKWLLIAILSVSIAALIGLVIALPSLSALLSVGSVVMAILCGVIIYYLQSQQLTQFFAHKRQSRQQPNEK